MSDNKKQNMQVGRIEFEYTGEPISPTFNESAQLVNSIDNWTGSTPPYFKMLLDNKDTRIAELEAVIDFVLQEMDKLDIIEDAKFFDMYAKLKLVAKDNSRE